MKRITKMQKDKKLNGLEVPKKIFCTSHEFTPDTILTPTMKLKRADAKKMFYTQIKQMYDNAKL